MVKGIINEKNQELADVVLLSVPYEKTASSHKGTARGPEAVIKCLNTQIEFFSRKYKKNTTDFIKIAHHNLACVENFTPEEALKQIKKASEKLINKNKFVFTLGGEHSIMIGIFEELAKKYNPKDVTILQIDAHCDLRENDSDYSNNPSNLAHSTVMRHASILGYNIIQVGVRTYSKEEYEYFSDKKNRIKIFEWGLCDKNGKNKIPEISEIINNIKKKLLLTKIINS